MASSRHILRQGSALSGLGLTALGALKQAIRPVKGPPALPGRRLEVEVEGPARDLVRDYIRTVGGDPKLYGGHIPAHFFPQWTFGLAARTMTGLPYPLAKVVNGGCRLEVRGPLPLGERLVASAQLVDIDDDGRRAIMHQVIETGPASQPDAVVAHLYPIVVYGKRDKGEGRAASPTVPADAREVAVFNLRGDAGLNYAKVTGDFNPIHWVPMYARMSGFKNTILHGFATMAWAIEGLNHNLFGHGDRIDTFDVRFRKPVVLPTRIGLYIDADSGADGSRGVYVGSSPGGDAAMMGSFTVRKGGNDER